MKTILLFCIIGLFLLLACNKDCRESGNYNFQLSATLSPAQDTFRMGDTITIISTFSDEVYEKYNNEYYHLVDFKFYPSTFIQKIDINPSIDGLDDFDIIIPDSSLYYTHFNNGDSWLYGEYTYNNAQYSLSFQLVPRERGLYYLEQAASPDLDNNQTFDGVCKRNPFFRAAVNLNNGDDNNIDLLQQSPDTHYNTWIPQKPQDRFYRFGGYVFYVTE
ncbi:MAG TPA: hypothetical protein PKH93_10130 [Chitinophagales bacterium]|nr:hypothetical protein [Chitinophagales bacterium]